jgi:2-hydroxy-3-oxopropionate reductase
MGSLPRIGLIGVGIMGRPMGLNLLSAGYQLTVYDVNPLGVADIVSAGGVSASSPREVAGAVDVLITMLPDSPQVLEVYLGANGAFEALRPDWLVIDMSSIDPAVSRDLAQRASAAGAEMLDAPVSGGDKGAIAGTLSIMVGGSDEAYARALPILSTMGKTVTHVGPPGSGQVVKVCNQVVVAVVIEAVAEALVLGAKAGVDPNLIADVLQGGLAATRVLEMRRENMIGGNFEPGFRIRLHLKDLKNAMELARANAVPLPAASQVEQLMLSMLASGRGELDHSALITVLQDLAGFSIPTFFDASETH